MFPRMLPARLVLVAGLVTGSLVGCANESRLPSGQCEGEFMHVDYERSGGFAGMVMQASFDTDSMADGEAQLLCDLIEAAGFFDLPSDLVDTTGADRFVHRITVAGEGREHTVAAAGESLPPAVQELVDWLDRAARRGRTRP